MAVRSRRIAVLGIGALTVIVLVFFAVNKKMDIMSFNYSSKLKLERLRLKPTAESATSHENYSTKDLTTSNRTKSLNDQIPAVIDFEEWKDTSSGCQTIQCPSDQVCFKDNSGPSCHDKSNVVHLALLADKVVVPGLIALLHSIIDNTRTNLKIYIVTNNQDYAEIQGKIDCLQLPQNIMATVINFNLPQAIKDLIVVHSSEHQYLQSTANFGRLFLANLLVQLDYILYIDSDTIVLDDLGVLWRKVYKTKQLMAAVSFPRIEPSVDIRHIYRMRYGKNITMDAQTINGGVLGMNLKKWRDNNITKEVEFWMAANKEKHLWDIGTQPVLNLLIVDDLKLIDKQWNACVWKKGFQSKNAKILHFHGHCKPWKCKFSKKKTWGKKWESYNRGLCSNKGKCVVDSINITAGTCECTTNNYHGRYCEKLHH